MNGGVHMIRYTDYSPNAKDLVNCGHSVQECPLEIERQYSRHFHDSYEILLLIKGDVHYNIDGERYALRPYDILLIPPTKYHFLIPMSNEIYESYVINLKVNFSEDERLQRLFSFPYIINISNDAVAKKMFSLFDQYYSTLSLKDFKVAAYHLISALLIYLSYKSKGENDGDRVTESDPLISSITAYISAHLEDELDAEVIARQMNFSRSYVQNRFSAVMGIGLKQYINRKKIYAARDEILGGESIYRVAEKYRFSDYSSFYRQYKRILGVSPKEEKQS